ncbi:MAG: phosphatase PAP2 family protein [Actinobacteria bacterium]|nr:phosphatase PAP2 family protein [Actinomycetota bacterium]
MTPGRLEADAPTPRSRRIRFGWVLEIIGVRAVTTVYDWARDQLIGSEADAFRHARQVIRGERLLGIYHEETIQEWFLPYRAFISFWNIFYASVHFVMPVVALVWLYIKAPARYVRWRNTLIVMLGLALAGFWLYPLMPPRLLPASYGFVDTRVEYFGLGEASRDPSADNLYAAMPSLHIGWSTWIALALWPLVRRPWAKALLVAYPAAQLFCTVVTGNHFFLDAVGGWVVLGLAYALASARRVWRRLRRAARGRPLSVADRS